MWNCILITGIKLVGVFGFGAIVYKQWGVELSQGFIMGFLLTLLVDNAWERARELSA